MPTFDPTARIRTIGQKLEGLATAIKSRDKAGDDDVNLAFALGADFFDLLIRSTHALERIADAQEVQTKLMQVDVDATIQQGIAAGLEDAVKQKVTENQKRTPLGGWE